MKIIVFYPTNDTSINMDISSKEEQRLYGKKLGEQFDGALISEQLSGSIVQLVGGNDYQGVCMSPKRETIKRIRLLLSKGDVGYRARKSYVRMRKTVRGSIVSSSIQVISVILVRVPDGKAIEGLTDTVRDKSHYPKKASKLRAMFGIPEGEDIMKFITAAVRANDPEARVPSIRITGCLTEQKKRERAEKLAARQARKERCQQEKSAYEAKYGVIQ